MPGFKQKILESHWGVTGMYERELDVFTILNWPVPRVTVKVARTSFVRSDRGWDRKHLRKEVMWCNRVCN